MNVLFFILTLFLSEYRIQIATYDTQGILPFRYGMYIFCIIADVVILIAAIFYLGIIAGVIYAALSYFSILHMIIAWVFKIPSLLFARSCEAIEKIIKWDSIVLVITIVVLAIFTVISFFVVDYQAALVFLREKWVLILSISVGGFLLRLLFIHKLA